MKVNNSHIIKTFFTSISFVLCVSVLFCQGTNCNNAAPFCTTTSSTFPAGVNQPDATVTAPTNNYDCLSSAPNPAWYYLEVDQSGNLAINISNTATADIDFAVWGPFNNITAAINACGSLPLPVDCSYSPTAYPEIANINGAVTGQVYIMIVTNYANIACNITLTNTGGASTNCGIVNPCSISSITTNLSNCSASTGNFNISGNVVFVNPPTTGQLVVQNCSGDSVIFNAPFTSPTSYTINDILGDGTPNCNVIGYFTDDSSCTFNSSSFNEPNCSCIIQSINNTVSNCDSVALTFDCSGTLNFVNPPTSGELIVQSCSGDSAIYNAPFTSPISYTINDIPGDGTTNCSVSAYFTADTTCTLTSSTFDEPICVSNCDILSVSSNISNCDSIAFTFEISGEVDFTGPPSSGQLIIQNCSGDSVIFNPPFVSPISYTINNIIGDGTANCSVSALFSNDSSCSMNSSTFNEPGCLPPCNITNLTINFDSCGVNDDLQFRGEITFEYPPSTGQLILKDCHGIQEVFEPPFISPIIYVIDSIPADGINCSLEAYFTDDTLCFDTTTFITHQFPLAFFYWKPDTLDVFNTDVEFIDQSYNAVSYDWTLDDNGSLQSFNTKEFNYSFSILQTGEYPICLNVTNEIGCSNLRCDTIKVEYPLLVYVPSGFTPLGLNNEFKPVIEYGALLDDYLFQVFNRNGQLIFETNEINKGWNGKFMGTGLDSPLGIYVWKIKVKDELSKKTHDYIGNVTLIR